MSVLVESEDVPDPEYCVEPGVLTGVRVVVSVVAIEATLLPGMAVRDWAMASGCAVPADWGPEGGDAGTAAPIGELLPEVGTLLREINSVLFSAASRAFAAEISYCRFKKPCRCSRVSCCDSDDCILFRGRMPLPPNDVEDDATLWEGLIE